MAGTWGRVARTLGRVAVREGPRIVREVQRARTARRPAGEPAPARRPPRRPGRLGRVLGYAPDLDGRADPGEVVWTWVPYEDDPARGKDRPVLVVGRDGDRLSALMLSSQADRDGQRGWLALGAGAWDGGGRPSWVRLDRVLTIGEDGIRREGAVLDRRRFDLVADALRRGHGWSGPRQGGADRSGRGR